MELLEEESIRFLYQTRLNLNEQISNNSLSETNGINENWEIIKFNILTAAKEALGTRTVKTPGIRKKTPWFCEEIKQLSERKRKAFLQFKSSGTTTLYNIYKSIRNEVNIQIRQIKRNFWEAYTKNLERDFYGQQRKIWRMIQNQKKEILEYVIPHNIDEKTWMEYFKKLYAGTPEECDRRDRGNSCVAVTKMEIDNTLKTLKNRKSAGEDGITNEMLKYGGPHLWEQIYVLIDQVFRISTIPEEWKTNIVISIFKKGEKLNPNNYRGINLLNTHLKLTTKIVSNKLSRIIKLHDEQQGFRKGRSCVDAIFAIRQLCEKAYEFNKPAFFCFIDIEKAFDKVQLKHVIKILE